MSGPIGRVLRQIGLGGPNDDKWFLGHPKGLGFLAGTEFWERFSFYGMQALLSLYLYHYLLQPEHIENIWFFKAFHSVFYSDQSGENLAKAIASLYIAFVYFTPAFGGLIADKWLGRTRAVLSGAILMAMGHFLMAFDQSFFIALSCLIVGSGLFKGNLASQIGGLYDDKDLRRADAFQIYYLSINIAVIIAPVITGWLGQTIAWHYGFGAAGVGMLISVFIYLSGLKHFPRDEVVEKHKAHKPVDPMTGDDWKMMGIILLLIPVLAIAVLPNQEIFIAYIVWADQTFNLQVLGHAFPSSWMLALDAAVSTTFLIVVAVFFRWYGRHWKEPDEITKIIIGCFFGIGGMLCLVIAALSKGPDGKIGMFWPVMFHVVNSIGFAMVLPVSLALFARLAPKQMAGFVVGLYSAIFFFAGLATSWVSGLMQTMGAPHFWLMHAGFAGFAGVVFILLKILLRKRLGSEPVEAEAKA